MYWNFHIQVVCSIDAELNKHFVVCLMLHVGFNALISFINQMDFNLFDTTYTLVMYIEQYWFEAIPEMNGTLFKKTRDSQNFHSFLLIFCCGNSSQNYPFYSWKGKNDTGIPKFLIISAFYMKIKKKNSLLQHVQGPLGVLIFLVIFTFQFFRCNLKPGNSQFLAKRACPLEGSVFNFWSSLSLMPAIQLTF